MPPLWLQLATGIAGGGVVYLALDRLTTLTVIAKWALAVSAISLLTTVQYLYVAYPTWPRVLAQWQREALIVNCPDTKRGTGHITYFIGSAPSLLEPDDYSKQLMEVFNVCHIDAAYGYDPFPRYIVANAKANAVIVPPDTNYLLRISGVELWVLDPRAPPKSATLLAKRFGRSRYPVYL